MKKICVLVLCILSLCCPSIQAMDKDTMQDLIVGNYFLIGKSIGNKNTYYGEVTIENTDSGLQVTRTINGNSIKAKATIEQTTGDKVLVLRIRFTENKIHHEANCLINSDLDNYARLTCHLYWSSTNTTDPGLEALFIKHSL